jgi:hypothetical protein
MKNLSDLLSHFKLIPDPKREKDLILKVILDVTGVELNLDSVEYSNQIVKISCHPIIKSKLFMYKDKILNSLNNELKKYDKVCKNII